MTLRALTPWTRMGLKSLSPDVDRFFDSEFENMLAAAAYAWTPAMDLEETSEGLRITADLPGVKKEDLHLDVQDGVLTIRGVRHASPESQNKETVSYCRERQYGEFARRFKLPTTVDADKISARHADGVLTVTVPKSAKAMLRTIQVS